MSFASAGPWIHKRNNLELGATSEIQTFWNINDATPIGTNNWQLTVNNTIAESLTGNICLIRATKGRSAGKYYFELVPLGFGISSNGWIGGIADPATPLTINIDQMLDATGRHFGWRAGSPLASLWKDTAITGLAVATAINDIIGFACDLDARSIDVRLNNVFQGNYTYPVAGTVFLPAFEARLANEKVQLKSLTSELTYPQAGYLAWGSVP